MSCDGQQKEWFVIRFGKEKLVKTDIVKKICPKVLSPIKPLL